MDPQKSLAFITMDAKRRKPQHSLKFLLFLDSIESLETGSGGE